MALVPDNVAPAVQPEATPPPDYMNIPAATPAAFGGLIGEAAQRTGREGNAAFSELAQTFGERYNKIAADDAVNKYGDASDKLMWGDGTPTNPGLYNLKGEDAVRAGPGVLQKLSELRENMKNGLYNETQKLEFDAQTRRLLQIQKGDLGRHIDQQGNVYGVAVNDAIQSRSETEAGQYYNDDNKIYGALANSRVGQGQKAHILYGNGASTGIIDAAISLGASRVVRSAVQSALAQQDPARAAQIMTKFGSFLDANTHEELVGRVKAMGDVRDVDGNVQYYMLHPGAVPAPGPSGAAVPVSKIADSIYAQESSRGANPATSPEAAIGGYQIMPATFQRYAKPGESITNPADNAAVGQRIIADYAQKYDNDPARVAVAYFSGPGNVAPAGSPTPWVTDAKDATGKSTSSYVSDVLGRLGPTQPRIPGAFQKPDGNWYQHDPYGSGQDIRVQTAGPALPPQLATTPDSVAHDPGFFDRIAQQWGGAEVRAQQLYPTDPKLQMNFVQKVHQQLSEQVTFHGQAEAEQAKAVKDAQTAAFNTYMPQILVNPSGVDIGKVAADNRLSGEDKWRIHQMIQSSIHDDAKVSDVSHQVAINLVSDIRSGRITDMGPIYDAYARKSPDGSPTGLTNADFNFVQNQFKEMQTADGQRLDQQMVRFLAAVKPSIDKSNPLMGSLDMSGGTMFFRLQQDIAARVAAMRAAHQDPNDLFNPKKPDYVGSPEFLSQYQTSIPESVANFAARMKAQQPVPKQEPPANVIVVPTVPSPDGGLPIQVPPAVRPPLDQIFGR